MKKILLLPITLTAFAPMFSMVGCKDNNEPKVITHTVTFSAGEHGSLVGESTVTVEGNETTLGEITKPTIVVDEGWDFDRWDHNDSYVINDDVTVTAWYESHLTVIDLNTDISDDDPGSMSSQFKIDTNKVYQFNISANICRTATSWDEFAGCFRIIDLGESDEGWVQGVVFDFVVREKEFNSCEYVEELEGGKYCWNDTLGWVYQDYKAVDVDLTISITLRFTNYDGDKALARWVAGT